MVERIVCLLLFFCVIYIMLLLCCFRCKFTYKLDVRLNILEHVENGELFYFQTQVPECKKLILCKHHCTFPATYTQ